MIKLILFLLFLPLFAKANPQHWRQFQLDIFPANKGPSHTSCTGTLLNINQSCRLITNAHCFKNMNDRVYVSTSFRIADVLPEHQYDSPLISKITSSRYGFFYQSQFNEVASLKKSFVSKDLAEITVSDKLRDLYCKDLKPVDLSVLKNVEVRKSSYAALGYFMGLETISFTGDKAWSHWKEKSLLKKIPSGLNLEFFYHVPRMTTFRGMSGGLLINDDLMPIGILTRHIPFQEESFIIGLQEVSKFLDEVTEPQAPNAEIYFKGNKLNNPTEGTGNEHGNGGNEHGNGGNEHGNGGNEHGNGGNEHGNGGNEHGNGGDDQKKKKTLKLFRLPDEGVEDPSNPENIILTLCGNQIDGYEDYVTHKNCKGPKETRRFDEYPVLELREQTLERIFGNFTNKLLRGPGTKIHFFEQREYLDGWRKLGKGTTEVTASASKNHFLLRFKSSKSFRLMDANVLPESVNNFDIYFTQDHDKKKITAYIAFVYERPSSSGRGTVYSLANIQLTCKNNNTLKLVCSDANDRFEFSVSKRAENSRSIKYRMAHRTGLNLNNIPGYELVTYYYGELTSDEKATLSDIPTSGELLPFLR